ncbi:hypothetical protein GGF31_000394 [Allomyces arbusculus]|nr:hypothetical protein GGF31_000394 [Allomyces arbusculus]
MATAAAHPPPMRASFSSTTADPAAGASAATLAGANAGHTVSVKLLRLSRPQVATGSLQAALPAPPPPSDGPVADDPLWSTSRRGTSANAPSSRHVRSSSVASSTASAATPPTPSLPSFITLPSTFGNIHLGEPLNFALVVNNDAPDQAAHLTSVKVELQTSSTRSNLLDANVADRAVLDVNQSTEFRAKHDIKELGMHILVVQVLYSVDGVQKYLRKFYKFQVLNPFQVKTKATPLPHGRVLLELSVQNLMASAVVLTKLALAPNTADYTCVDMTSRPPFPLDPAAPPTKPSPLFSTAQMQPDQIRQYLYMFTPRAAPEPCPAPQPGAVPTASNSALGRLEVEWHGGERGRLQTPPLPRKWPAPGHPAADLDVRALACPTHAAVGVPFTITLAVTNLTNMTVALSASTAGIPAASAATPSSAASRPTSPPSPTSASSPPPLPPTRSGRPATSSLLTSPFRSSSASSARSGGSRAPTPTRHRPGSAGSTAPNGGPTSPLTLDDPVLPPAGTTPENLGAQLPPALLVVVGPATTPLGDLLPAQSAQWTVRAVALRRGVLALPVIRLADSHTGAVREIDSRVSVVVGGCGVAAAAAPGV